MTPPVPDPHFPPGVTAAEARAALVAHLCAREVPEPEAVTDFALADLLGGGRWTARLHPERTLTGEQAGRLADYARRLGAHEPLAYVLGWAEFHGRRFRCDARALIPRPETEGLADAALNDPAWRLTGRPCAADVGVGTGCLALTLALDRPDARVIGVDLDDGALNLARENAALLRAGSRVEWRQADLLAGQPTASLDVIVANLPYVPDAETDGLDRHVREFEPRRALAGGPDGLTPIRRLIPQAAEALRPGGLLALEIGEGQADAVQRALAAAGFADIRARRDLRGHPRVLTARHPAS